jgi:hypothetical protein
MSDIFTGGRMFRMLMSLTGEILGLRPFVAVRLNCATLVSASASIELRLQKKNLEQMIILPLLENNAVQGPEKGMGLIGLFL